MGYVTIDFEASCLPRHGRSFPIEVGIAGSFGAQSWLIRPDERWRDWDWTEEAFRLHGISREQLYDEGIAPEKVLGELRQVIAGRRAIADSRIDSEWWNTLSAATPYPHASPIGHVSDLLDEWGASSDMIFKACREADRISPARHRAAADARWLWSVLSSVREQQAEAAGTHHLWEAAGAARRASIIIHSSQHKEINHVA